MVRQHEVNSRMVLKDHKNTADDDFKSILDSYYSPLCHYALKHVGSIQVAEDLVQDLFLQLYERNALNGISHLDRYLIKSVKFKCIDYHRNKRKYREVSFEDYMNEPTEASSELSEDEIEPMMHYFAAKLPEKTREVFLLSRNEGKSYKEISEELNISVKTVEGQMGRALRQLRMILKAQKFFSLLPFL